MMMMMTTIRTTTTTTTIIIINRGELDGSVIGVPPVVAVVAVDVIGVDIIVVARKYEYEIHYIFKLHFGSATFLIQLCDYIVSIQAIS